MDTHGYNEHPSGAAKIGLAKSIHQSMPELPTNEDIFAIRYSLARGAMSTINHLPHFISFQIGGNVKNGLVHDFGLELRRVKYLSNDWWSVTKAAITYKRQIAPTAKTDPLAAAAAGL